MIDAGRTSVANTGEAFAANAFTLWGYNTRSELESSKRYTGTYTPTPDSGDEVTSQRRLYEYDPIGNRTESTKGTGSATFYCANELNQYKATRGAGDSCPTPTSPTEAFEYDADGNLIEDGQFVYTWDGENRLIAVAPAASPVNGDKKLEFQYDYMSRRVEKKVYTYSSGWGSPTEVLRFVYDRWNVILVLDGLDNNAVLKKYTWGLDLSGQRGDPSVTGIHGAGGIGGLLAAVETGGEHAGAYWFFYDANGNVGQVIKASNQSLAAHYEYDPYGNLLNTPTGYAAANPLRFSTKWFDDETGLGYWGYRYYSPRLGRWLSRDPIGERGGTHLYVFVFNRTSTVIDVLGKFGYIDGRWLCPPKVPSAPAPLMAPSTEVLDNPIDTLWHYMKGIGVPATLSPELVQAIQGYSEYQNLLKVTIPQDIALQCKGSGGRVVTTSGSVRQVLTSPVQPGLIGDEGFWFIEPGYDFELNNTIGTINNLQWTAKACCGCSAALVHIVIDDVYTFDTGVKDLLFHLLFDGTPFPIHNEWDDVAPLP